MHLQPRVLRAQPGQLHLLGRHRLGPWRVELASGSQCMAFAGVSDHPLPPPWTWLPCVAGLAAAIAASPLVGPLVLVGSLPLTLNYTAAEPHRLSLLFLALTVATGVGAARLWQQRWGPALCVGLLAFGMFHETRAWITNDPNRVEVSYGLSNNLMES